MEIIPCHAWQHDQYQILRNHIFMCLGPHKSQKTAMLDNGAIEYAEVNKQYKGRCKAELHD